MQQDAGIDTLLLACTHYPLLMDKIKKYVPTGVTVITQGEIAAASLSAYLQKHNEIEMHISKGGEKKFYTTDSTEDFDTHAAVFYGSAVQSIHVDIL